MEHLNAQNDPKQQTKCSGSKSQSCSCSQTLDVKPPKGPVVEKIEKVTLTWESEESNPNEPDVSDGKEVETVPVEQLPDNELPGKSANISHVFLACHKIWIQFNSWTQKFVEFHCSVDPQNQMFTEKIVIFKRECSVVMKLGHVWQVTELDSCRYYPPHRTALPYRHAVCRGVSEHAQSGLHRVHQHLPVCVGKRDRVSSRRKKMHAM